MYITEFFGKAEDYGNRTEKDDNTALKLSDLRKTRLSLAQINRLRIMNDVRRLEHEQHLKKIHKQYAVPAAADAAGGPAGL